MTETEIFEEVLERAREYAALGAQLLDEERPGWAREIDLEMLNMASPCNCVLGQIFGHYDYGLRCLGLGYGREYGFNKSVGGYTVLDQIWIELTDERLPVPA